MPLFPFFHDGEIVIQFSLTEGGQDVLLNGLSRPKVEFQKPLTKLCDTITNFASRGEVAQVVMQVWFIIVKYTIFHGVPPMVRVSVSL